MALEYIGATQSENSVTVTLAAAPGQTRNVLTDRDAQRQAIAIAAPYLNRAGFNKFGNWGYIPEGQDKPLTDEQMLTPGSVVANKGRYIQEYVIAGQP
jgi:hypothetical protein